MVRIQEYGSYALTYKIRPVYSKIIFPHFLLNLQKVSLINTVHKCLLYQNIIFVFDLHTKKFLHVVDIKTDSPWHNYFAKQPSDQKSKKLKNVLYLNIDLYVYYVNSQDNPEKLFDSHPFKKLSLPYLTFN